MSAPTKVLLGIPCCDYRPDIEHQHCVNMLQAAMPDVVRPFWQLGDSNIRHARNAIAQFFMAHTEFDALVFIDSDIIFSMADFSILMDGEEDVVVCPYSRKRIGQPPVTAGMGFCRIGRSVFESLNDWRDDEGRDMLNRYYTDGQIATDFFFDGATNDARWFGEDTGFLFWCQLRGGITVRWEKRTRLGHVGRMIYWYPNQIRDDDVKLADHTPPEINNSNSVAGEQDLSTLRNRTA